jgi:hypothetical protein
MPDRPLLLLACFAPWVIAAAPGAQVSKPATRAISTRAATTRAATTRAATTRAAFRRGMKNPALDAAIEILTREYQEFLRRPSSSALRTQSSYFREHPAPELPPDAIVAALLQPRGDPRLQAYIKWQLLSGLPDLLDDKLAAELFDAYRASPAPIGRPGISQLQRQQLDQRVRGRPEAEKSEIELELDAAVSRNDQENRFILAYRDALYQKLPRTIETFAAALADAQQRFEAAADAKSLLKDFDRDVRSWALTAGAAPQSLAALARAARRLAAEKGPDFYKTLSWNSRRRALVWRKSHADLGDEKALAEVAAFLEEQATAPALKAPLAR